MKYIKREEKTFKIPQTIDDLTFEQYKFFLNFDYTQETNIEDYYFEFYKNIYGINIDEISKNELDVVIECIGDKQLDSTPATNFKTVVLMGQEYGIKDSIGDYTIKEYDELIKLSGKLNEGDNLAIFAAILYNKVIGKKSNTSIYNIIKNRLLRFVISYKLFPKLIKKQELIFDPNESFGQEKVELFKKLPPSVYAALLDFFFKEFLAYTKTMISSLQKKMKQVKK